MKLFQYIFSIALFIIITSASPYENNSYKDVTFYFHYKSIKNNIFYVYNENDSIVYKSKSDKNNYIIDSVTVNAVSFKNGDIYLPFSALSRKGKKISSIKFHIQNINDYNYIYIDHIESIKNQYYFRVYYFKSPINLTSR